MPGHSQPKPGQRITGDQRTDLAQDYLRRYNAGTSLRAIAVDTGRSYGFVHKLLREAGATMRARGGWHRRPAATTRRHPGRR